MEKRQRNFEKVEKSLDRKTCSWASISPDITADPKSSYTGTDLHNHRVNWVIVLSLCIGLLDSSSVGMFLRFLTLKRSHTFNLFAYRNDHHVYPSSLFSGFKYAM
jgi:hypothetical protein